MNKPARILVITICKKRVLNTYVFLNKYFQIKLVYFPKIFKEYFSIYLVQFIIIVLTMKFVSLQTIDY